MFEDNVYYKVYYVEHKNYVTVVCLQSFDECDYLEGNFFKDEYGDVIVWSNEDQAIEWLLNNVKEQWIDPDYLNSASFNQKRFMK